MAEAIRVDQGSVSRAEPFEPQLRRHLVHRLGVGIEHQQTGEFIQRLLWRKPERGESFGQSSDRVFVRALR
jgi:hypothetical protein